MASSLAIYYTPMHFMWGVKSGATPVMYKSKWENDREEMVKVRGL